MTMNEAVRFRITELLERNNITLYELSKRSGIPKSTLQSLMDGSGGSPKLRTIEKIADGFQISVRDFFDSAFFADSLY